MEFDGVLGALSAYSAIKKEYIEAKNKLWNNAKNVSKGREKIIEGLENGIFPLIYDEKKEKQTSYEEENNIRNENGLIDYEKLEKLIDLKTDINDEFRNHFLVEDMGALFKKLSKSRNNTEKNYIQVVTTNSALRDLKEKIEDTNEQEKETENPNEIVDIAEMILEFNRQQQRQSLKILTPNQMLSRLPILLPQLKVGNNSENLQNETKHLL